MLHLPQWWYFNIYGWKDILELLIFSGAIYYVSLWLKQDRQKPLLFSFYGYCGSVLLCRMAQLDTTSTALLMLSPVLFVVFIVLHQHTLQRNFVALHALTPAHSPRNDWLEQFMRGCLSAMSHSKTVHCVIEKKDALNELLEGSCLLDSEISEGLMELIIKSKHFDNSKILWIQSKGLVRALNSLWKQSSVASWLSAEVQEQEVWLQNALFFTSKVDALYFKADPETRTFTLVAQGKLLERVSAHAALKTVRRYLSLPDAEKKGEFHVTGRTITSPEQSLT